MNDNNTGINTPTDASVYVLGKLKQIAADAVRSYNGVARSKKKQAVAAIAKRSFALGFFVANTLRDNGVRIEIPIDQNENN